MHSGCAVPLTLEIFSRSTGWKPGIFGVLENRGNTGEEMFTSLMQACWVVEGWQEFVNKPVLVC